MTSRAALLPLREQLGSRSLVVGERCRYGGVAAGCDAGNLPVEGYGGTFRDGNNQDR